MRTLTKSHLRRFGAAASPILPQSTAGSGGWYGVWRIRTREIKKGFLLELAGECQRSLRIVNRGEEVAPVGFPTTHPGDAMREIRRFEEDGQAKRGQ